MADLEQAQSAETLVTLRYLGPDVDDGSIGVDDLLSALNGFSSAFYKVAERVDLDQKQRIKVTGITQSSANIHLAILDIAKSNPQMAGIITTGLLVAGKKAYEKFAEIVIDKIADIAKAKKHVQGGTYTTETSVSGDNNKVLIVNNLNVNLPVDKDVFRMFQDGTIDSDLDKLTSPLREDSINGFEIKHDGRESPDLRLEASDRPYFAKPRREKTKTQEMSLIGTLSTLAKSNNSGIFITDSGKRIRYKFSEEGAIPDFYRQFAHMGLVKITCVARLDENLDVISIEINDASPYDPKLG